MTFTLSRYGPMDKPGEMHVPKVGSSPVDILLGAYAVWTQVAMLPMAPAEQNYYDAVRILAPHKKALEDSTQETFDGFFSRIPAMPNYIWWGQGAFITAAFNLSGLAKLVDTGHEGIGYRLAEGKQLIVNNKNRLFFAGDYAKGDIALLGDGVEFAKYSQGGVQISWEDISSGAAISSVGGIKINCGQSHRFGEIAKGCFLVSYAQVGYFGTLAEDTVSLNYGEAKSFGYDAKGGFRINEEGLSFPDSNISTVTDSVQNHRKRAGFYKLLEGVRTLKVVAGMPDRPEEALAMIKAYDWKGLEIRLRAVVGGDGRG